MLILKVIFKVDLEPPFDSIYS